MELLLTWISTIGISWIMVITTLLKLYKEIAKSGYKMCTSQNKSEYQDIDPQNISILTLFVPIINLIYSSKMTIHINQNMEDMIYQLKILGVIEPMNELEIEEFEKKPTGLNAMLAPAKAQLRIDNAAKIIITKEGNKNGKIYFEFEENLKDVRILKVTGVAKELTEEEQKERIKDFWDDFMKKIINNPNLFDNVYEVKESHIIIGSGESKDKKEIIEEALKEIKNEEEKTDTTDKILYIIETEEEINDIEKPKVKRRTRKKNN